MNKREVELPKARLSPPLVLWFCFVSVAISIGCIPAPADSQKQVVPDDAVLTVEETSDFEVRVINGGEIEIEMPPSARVYSIHRDYSPQAETLIDVAKRLAGSGQRVRFTIWNRDPSLNKANLDGSGVPGPPWVVVKLSERRD